MSVVHVRGDETGPSLTHTVGLSPREGQAELVVSGLEMAVSSPLLGLATQEVCPGGGWSPGTSCVTSGPRTAVRGPRAWAPQPCGTDHVATSVQPGDITTTTPPSAVAGAIGIATTTTPRRRPSVAGPADSVTS